MRRIFEWLQRLVSRRAQRQPDVEDTVGIHTNVRVAVYDATALRDSVPDWDVLEEAEKLAVADAHEPLHVSRSRNTTTADLFEYLVDELDPGQTVDVDVTHLAVGNDGTQPASGNRSLNNEVYRTQTASTDDASDTLDTRTLLDTSEANGYTIREIGLVTASTGGLLLNHSLIQEELKTDRKAFTIDVSLTAGPA